MKYLSLSTSVTMLALSALVTVLGVSAGQDQARASGRTSPGLEFSLWHPDSGHQDAPSLFAVPTSDQHSAVEQMPSSGKASAPLSHADIVKQTTTTSGHKVEAVPGGAKITCQLQTLEGDLTPAGLSIRSIGQSEPGQSEPGAFSVRTAAWGRDDHVISVGPGQVIVDDSVARLVHDGGLIEEVSTTSDGIRQDWVIAARPAGSGSLNVDVALDGATVTAHTDNRVDLTVSGGRELVWHQLFVTDAAGTELAAKFSQRGDNSLRLTIEDQHAVYPIRVDPTFTDADWVSMGGIPGTNQQVFALALYESGIVAAGEFTVAGTVEAMSVAYWNGSVWSALGTGMSMNGDVLALAVSGTDLYAGGIFTTAGGVPAKGIAKWDGTTWSALGSGITGTVNALAISGTDLYVGGYFTKAASLTVNNIAKWNGTSWSKLGTLTSNTGVDNRVRALAVSGSNLYVGGSFGTAGGTAVGGIAKWNGSAWSALGSGMSGGYVEALAISDTGVYAAGYFTTAGGVVANRIAHWNGTTWSPLGTGIDTGVRALAVSGSNLYAAGFFTTAGDVAVNRIAKWDGNAWSALGSGVGSAGGYYANAIVVLGADIYVGGQFHTAGDGAANYIAQWNDSTWSALGTGMNERVTALAVVGTDVYAGGYFTTAGDGAANYIAKWNGSTWSALDEGVNHVVTSLAVLGTDLYVGGVFTTAGGVPANRIAKWNGSAWSALGLGMNGTVLALAASDTQVYAGGSFTTAGNIVANYAAKWDGTAWSTLGTGLNDSVIALAVSDTGVYAGGDFTTFNGGIADHIAHSNGTVWSEVGTGINSSVWALATSGSHVYAGGDFTMAGGSSARAIAKWDGSAWSEVGAGGITNYVYSLAVVGSDLYAGGWFNSAGGVTASGIAQWNGSTWSALGSGIGGRATALAALGTDLYVGGNFTTAGGKVSPYLAIVTIPNSAPNNEVTYRANGATGGTVPAAQTKIDDVDLTLATNSGMLVKTGSTFADWNTAADGSGTPYAAEAIYSPNAGMTLYAQWTLNTYAVTYDDNGSTSGTVPTAQTKTHGVNLTLATNSGALAKTGSTFTGWNTTDDGSGTAYAAGATYSANADVMLYAQWTTLATYAVTYDGNGSTSGTIPAAHIKTEDVNLILADNSGALAKSDFNFAGWNTASDGSGTTYAAGATYSTNAHVTLYAKWTASGSGGGSTGGSSGGGSSSGCGSGSGFATALGLLLLVCGMRLNGLGLRNRP